MKQEEPYILSLRLQRELVETLRMLARAHQRSLHGEVVWAVRQYITQQTEGNPHALHRASGTDRQD